MLYISVCAKELVLGRDIQRSAQPFDCCPFRFFLVVQDGIQKVAEPIGIIAGIVPTTNPTSTVIFKCLLALKTRSVLCRSVCHGHVDEVNAGHAVCNSCRLWQLLFHLYRYWGETEYSGKA